MSFLSGHSSVVLLTEKKNGLLRPLPVTSPDYLPEDLPEYDETVYSGWMLDREEGELPPYIPVYEDLVLKLKPLG